MSKKKIAVILASTVLIASLAIGGTLAYLTADATVSNTFTVGNVDIELAEPLWDAVANRGLGVVPGDTIPKDPTVTATAGDSYMRVKVEIVSDDGLDMDAERAQLIKDTIRGWNNDAVTGFTLATSPAPTATTFYYNYNSIFSEDTSAPATLFTSIHIPEAYTSEQIKKMGEYKINITAQAIQSDNFAGDATAAFAKLSA